MNKLPAGFMHCIACEALVIQDVAQTCDCDNREHGPFCPGEQCITRWHDEREAHAEVDFERQQELAVDETLVEHKEKEGKLA